MADYTLACDSVVVANPPVPNFVINPPVSVVEISQPDIRIEVANPPQLRVISRPPESVNIVLPVSGPPGANGESGLYDSSVPPVSATFPYLRFERDGDGDVQTIYLGTAT